jgi:hypothetical protein
MDFRDAVIEMLAGKTVFAKKKDYTIAYAKIEKGVLMVGTSYRGFIMDNKGGAIVGEALEQNVGWHLFEGVTFHTLPPHSSFTRKDSIVVLQKVQVQGTTQFYATDPDGKLFGIPDSELVCVC